MSKLPGIAGSDAGVSKFPVFAAVEGVGLALAGGDYRVQATVTQGVSVDTTSSSSSSSSWGTAERRIRYLQFFTFWFLKCWFGYCHRPGCNAKKYWIIYSMSGLRIFNFQVTVSIPV